MSLISTYTVPGSSYLSSSIITTQSDENIKDAKNVGEYHGPVPTSFHATKALIILGLEDGTIHVLDSGGSSKWLLKRHTGAVWSLVTSTLSEESSSSSTDYQLLASGSADKTIIIWDMETG